MLCFAIHEISAPKVHEEKLVILKSKNLPSCIHDAKFTTKEFDQKMGLENVTIVVEESLKKIISITVSTYTEESQVDSQDIKSIDFTGIENLNLVFNPKLVNIINHLKFIERRLPIGGIIGTLFRKFFMHKVCSKYIFVWDGSVQENGINPRVSFFQMEETDVGRKLG